MRLESRPRTWVAALTLYFLAPILGEVFSFNTPPLAFIVDPSKLIFEPALYGSGALLIREIARRRALGWPAIVVMGAGYGVLEEAIFIHLWLFHQNRAQSPLRLQGARTWESEW
jgi:hypothetical protein